MNVASTIRRKIGELRPSQVLMAFGVGSIVDLPNVSAMVMGLDDWPTQQPAVINESRLLAAVKNDVGMQVEQLLAPPPQPETVPGRLPDEDVHKIGVPVAPFPRWLICPW